MSINNVPLFALALGSLLEGKTTLRKLCKITKPWISQKRWHMLSDNEILKIKSYFNVNMRVFFLEAYKFILSHFPAASST